MKDSSHSRGNPSAEANHDSANPPELKRRHFLGSVAMAGVGASLTACATDSPRGSSAMAPGPMDAALQKHVKTVVVIYGENRSFNNLFANFPGLEKPLSALKPGDFAQRDRNGALLGKLPPTWGGMVQVGNQVVKA